VESHDGATVHDEAYLSVEGGVETFGEISQGLIEKLALKRDVIDGFQSLY
jgi:hypothetical protein